MTLKAESRKRANRGLAFILRFLIDYCRHIHCKIAYTFFTYVAQRVQNCPFWQQDGSKRFSPLWLDRFPWLHSVQLPENAAQQGDNGKHFFPTRSDDEGRLRFAPYSLRKIEAALLEYGFTRDEVIIADPRKLDRAIGPETKAIGLDSA